MKEPLNFPFTSTHDLYICHKGRDCLKIFPSRHLADLKVIVVLREPCLASLSHKRSEHDAKCQWNKYQEKGNKGTVDSEKPYERKENIVNISQI